MSEPKEPNGHGGEHHYNAQAEEPETPERVKLCCVRIGNGSWCQREDGHFGDHFGPPAEHGPLEARPALWRSMRGKTR